MKGAILFTLVIYVWGSGHSGEDEDNFEKIFYLMYAKWTANMKFFSVECHLQN